MGISVNRPILMHIQNHFQRGAIPHIIRDLQPVVGKHYEVHTVALQDIKDQTLVDEFKDIGITVHALGCSRWNLPLAAFRLRTFLSRKNPAVVHAHAGRGAMLAPLCAPVSTKVFTTFHNVASGFSFPTRKGRLLTDRWLTGRTCVSEAVNESWRAFGINNAATVYNPVDVSRYKIDTAAAGTVRKEFNIPEDVKLLLNVGRLTFAKAQDVLLDAVAALKKQQNNDFRLIIAGQGPDEEKLKARAKELGLEETVYFAGFRKDVQKLLAAADIFVFPSRWEGLPVTALEAMAAGTVVLASDIKPTKEYLTDGVSGLVTPVNDAKKLSDCLNNLLNNKAKRERFAAAGQAYVRQYFAPEYIARQYLSIYEGRMNELK